MTRPPISFRCTCWILAAILAAGLSLSSVCMRPCCDRVAGACCAGAPEAAQARLPAADSAWLTRSSHDFARVFVRAPASLTLAVSLLAHPGPTIGKIPESPPPVPPASAILRI